MEYTKCYPSPLGSITLASDGENLTGLWFDGQKYYGAGLPEHPVHRELEIFDRTQEWLDLYFSGREPDFTPALSLAGSSFRRDVWEIMLTIPFGQTMTYREIAEKLAARRGVDRISAHPVGGAVAHNPITLIIPCHRVVGSNGSLTGYAGGLEKKVRLLQLEKADMSNLFVPVKGTAL